jgi:O-6-methylguanine DNA methyltransferase
MQTSASDIPFIEQVWEVSRLIPYGRVTNYGAIARALGTARSSRMVGWALKAAVDQADIPAHRVLNRQGRLSGKMHFSSPNKMQELLEAEGIQVVNDTVIHFKELFWDPFELLD